MAALEKAQDTAVKLETMKLAKAAAFVRKSVNEKLTYMGFPREHWQRLPTNNPLERVMKEIKRRTRVVGAFPDGHSALMLSALTSASRRRDALGHTEVQRFRTISKPIRPPR